MIYGDDLSMHRLFSSCPLLEDLEICRQGWDGTRITSISIPTLKRLSIFISCFDDYNQGYEFKTVVDAPNLEYLELNDNA